MGGDIIKNLTALNQNAIIVNDESFKYAILNDSSYQNMYFDMLYCYKPDDTIMYAKKCIKSIEDSIKIQDEKTKYKIKNMKEAINYKINLTNKSTYLYWT